MVKLSVIIPIYNVDKYLECCLQSITNQSLNDIEIILVDDASSDTSPEICDKFAQADKRIQVIHKDINEGLGFARNTGLRKASGDFVTFVDSDDFIDRQALEHLYNLIGQYDLDVIYYAYSRFRNPLDSLSVSYTDKVDLFTEHAIMRLMLDLIGSDPAADFDRRIQCSSCTAIYRREIIVNNDLYFHSERELISEDLIFNLDFLSQSKRVGYNNSILYHYRLNPISITTTLRRDRVEKNYKLYNYILSKISDWGLETDAALERANRFFIGSSRSAIYHYMSSSVALDKDDWLYMQLDKQIWRELYDKYRWKSLPLYPKLFFLACVKKNVIMIKLLCNLKSIIK